MAARPRRRRRTLVRGSRHSYAPSGNPARWPVAARWPDLCPLTEASLGDGIFNGADYLVAGGRFGIGTDSNIQIDAAAELRQLEYGQRLAHRARNVMALRGRIDRAAVVRQRRSPGGAQALAAPDRRARVGLRADIVLLDADHPDLAARPAMLARRLDLRRRTARGENGAGRRRHGGGGGPPPAAARSRRATRALFQAFQSFDAASANAALARCPARGDQG